MGEPAKRKKRVKREKDKKTINDDQACKIMISCGHPTPDGKMAVQMTYEGDPSLASYLLESAQGFIDHEDETSQNPYL